MQDEALELRDVSRRQPPEGAGDIGLLRGDPANGEVGSGRGQVQRIGTPIARDRPALDEPGLDEPVDQPGDITLRDVEPGGQILLCQALAFRKGREHVELRDREPDRTQFDRNRGLDPAVEADETEPDPERIGGGGPGHR